MADDDNFESRELAERLADQCSLVCDYVNEHLADGDFEALAPAGGEAGMSATDIETAIRDAGVTARGITGRRQYRIDAVLRGESTLEVKVPIFGGRRPAAVAVCRVREGSSRPLAILSIGPYRERTAR